MHECEAVSRAKQLVKEYAAGREHDVARGAETAHLAGLLVQKYGRGLSDAIAAMFDSPRAADPVTQAVDEAVTRIDPQWREHANERWSGRPADIVVR